MYDVLIIGAGVIGCSIARELSRYNLKTLVIEKESDVCAGTSKANSAIIHAGFDAMPNTLKGKLNAKANLLFDNLSKELDFHFKRNGSLVLCFDENDKGKLLELLERGRQNGVAELKVISGEDVRKMEPEVSEKVVAALYAPNGGIVCPFNLTIALAENANTNGVDFRFDSEVVGIKKNDGIFEIDIGDERIYSRIVVNAAGIHSDTINDFISNESFKIIPRRGEYNLFDKYAGNLVKSTLFQLPTKQGKGIVVSPTADGNLLVGPNAINVNDRNDLSVTKDGLDEIMEKASLSINALPRNLIITSFSGLRATSDTKDFIIGEAKDCEGFINAAGIDSPGLTCAPLIGQMVKEIIAKKLKPEVNKNFNGKREAIRRFSEMSMDERKEAIKNNSNYGNIICRCEMVTEGEIIEAISRPLGARDLDGVKRRTRAGSGRCQCGFCIARIMEIINSEKKIPLTQITKFGRGSNIIVGKIKEDL